MPQNPLSAQAFAQQGPGGQLRAIQCDSSGNVLAVASAVVADLDVPAANGTANVFERDVIGNKTDNAVYNPSASASLAAYVKALADLQENVSVTAAAVMSNALEIFAINGGPIQLLALLSICATPNDTTASTLQWQSNGTLGTTAQTISGASASLASATAGTSVIAQLTALSTAPIVNANGAGISATPGGIIVPAGNLKLVIGVGSTVGTWSHYIRYRPLAPGVSVVNQF